MKMGVLNSLNIFLKQEIARMQKVLTLVRQTLTDLKLAIEGTIIMSEVKYFDCFSFEFLVFAGVVFCCCAE